MAVKIHIIWPKGVDAQLFLGWNLLITLTRVCVWLFLCVRPRVCERNNYKMSTGIMKYGSKLCVFLCLQQALYMHVVMCGCVIVDGLSWYWCYRLIVHILSTDWYMELTLDMTQPIFVIGVPRVHFFIVLVVCFLKCIWDIFFSPSNHNVWIS